MFRFVVFVFIFYFTFDTLAPINNVILFVLVGIVVIRFFFVCCCCCWSRWTKVRCAVIKAVNWNVTKKCCSSNTHTKSFIKTSTSHQIKNNNRHTKMYWVIEWLKISFSPSPNYTYSVWLLFFLYVIFSFRIIFSAGSILFAPVIHADHSQCTLKFFSCR